MNIVAVGLGGMIGAILRYLVNLSLFRILGNVFPFGTLFVNVVGGLIMGMVISSGTKWGNLSPVMLLFLTTGFLGGFTTFSAFSYETVSLLVKGDYWLGATNIFLNLGCSLLAFWVGYKMISFL